jgi:hypothetical protein
MKRTKKLTRKQKRAVMLAALEAPRPPHKPFKQKEMFKLSVVLEKQTAKKKAKLLARQEKKEKQEHHEHEHHVHEEHEHEEHE